MQEIRVSVRAMVERALMSGDLSAVEGARKRMLEGMLGHRRIQDKAEGGVERFVRYTLEGESVALCVTGRIDLLDEETSPPTVIEIKTTLRPVESIGEDDYPLHWAQAYCYAFMLAEEAGHEQVAVCLLYVPVEGEGHARFTRTLNYGQLRALFMAMALHNLRLEEEAARHRAARDASIKALSFPYPSYRAGQRELAGQIYVALRDKKRVFAEAPTGTGKTAASLFPALKAMGEGHLNRIFYLTAKTTTRAVAEAALDTMRAAGLHARVIGIVAKDKLCPHPGTPCDPELCDRARGHFDRLGAAMEEALDAASDYDRAFIEAHCARHCLCPHEFQLDLSECCDLILCDYNYIFDPLVKLKRYMDDRTCALIIDEAHNLPDRARGMFSATLVHTDFTELRRAVGKGGRKGKLYKAAAGLCRAFKALEPSSVAEKPPEAFNEAVLSFLDAASAALEGYVEARPQLMQCYMDAEFYRFILDRYDERHGFVVEAEGRRLTATLLNMDPAKELKQAMRRRGAALFSATLSPAHYYKEVLGGEPEDADIALPSPFPRERLSVLCMPVNTRYTKRTETLSVVAGALRALCAAAVGNYMCYFPSYRYMEAVVEAFEACSPEGAEDIDIIRQTRDMDDAAREAFIARFVDKPQRTLAGFAVMGGIFAEGIDLVGDRLSGVAVVGVGMPQIGPHRDALRAYFENKTGGGFEYAYVYPGLNRVVQAAGRLIRTASDRGVVLLLDDRFISETYLPLLPPHWKPVKVVRDVRRLDAIVRAFYERG